MVKHPAKSYDFDTLESELDLRVKAGFVTRVVGKDGLVLYNYNNSCVYDKAWDEFTLMARGLILDAKARQIVATPFPKFFNYGENNGTIPDLPFEAYEKMDGSLIIVFYHNNKWQCATRGSFTSDQAKWAQEKIQKYVKYLEEGCTYLFESIYTSNRIVVKYDYEELVLLGAYDVEGVDASPLVLETLSIFLKCRKAQSYQFKNFADILKKAPQLTRNEEGFVVRFENGLRVKIKGDEYKRVHAMISNLSPLSIWNSMFNKDDLESIRKELPEEFWEDFDKILSCLTTQKMAYEQQVQSIFDKFNTLTPKQIGLSQEIPNDYKKHLFEYLKSKDLYGGKCRDSVFMSFRPTGNKLPGYSISETLKDVQTIEG